MTEKLVYTAQHFICIPACFGDVHSTSADTPPSPRSLQLVRSKFSFCWTPSTTAIFFCQSLPPLCVCVCVCVVHSARRQWANTICVCVKGEPRLCCSGSHDVTTAGGCSPSLCIQCIPEVIAFRTEAHIPHTFSIPGARKLSF